MKTCSMCKVEKPVTSFGKRGPNNLRGDCKDCRRDWRVKNGDRLRAEATARYHRIKGDHNYQLASAARNKVWHEANRPRRIAEAIENYNNRRVRSPEAFLVSRLKSSAVARGIHFDLRPEDIEIPPTCPVLGIPIAFRTDGGKGPAQNSPSVDRLVPSLGYVKGNVVVMSHRANTLKNNATIEELEAVLAYLRSS